MSQQEKDTAFFRALLSGHGEQECRTLQSRLHETERNQRSVRRAAFLAAVLGLFSLAGLGYSALFRAEILGDSSHFLVRLFSVTGLTSLICLTGFLGYWLHFRQMAGRLHDECRAFFLGALAEPLQAADRFFRTPTVGSRDNSVLQFRTGTEPTRSNLIVLSTVSEAS